MLRNVKFGYVVHELWSKNMAVNGGTAQKNNVINTFKQVVCVRGLCFMPNLDFLQNRVHSGSIRSVLTLT